MIANMKHLPACLAVVLAGASVCSIRGQSIDPLKPGISTGENGAAVAPYYAALKRGDWSVVSEYCILTADSKPRKYYYDPTAIMVKDDSVWRMIRTLPVVYTDPKSGAAPEASVLVIGAFTAPIEVVSPEGRADVVRMTTFPSLESVTMDVWLRDNNRWRVIPEGELHTDAIHLEDLPYHGTGLGRQFDQLAEVEAKAKEDREKREALRLQARKQIEDHLKKIQPLLQKKGTLTPGQIREGFKQLMPGVPPPQPE